ncbi:MAG: homoserine dehydrogenase [Peptoniphilaceae bacterium]|nr:homoserine dehydrogenase [Peptoniphilaceae bacterium]MDY3738571.1 homoserine dehydrogenase [Peptoniphilaceae bacterium]
MKIGLIGFGTVGRGVYEILKTINDIEVRKIVTNHPQKITDVNKELLSNDINLVVNDDEIDVVIEATGAVDIIDFVIDAIKKKKSFVTSNKELVSKYYNLLTTTANKNDVYFLCEASVAGAIPIIKNLRDIERISNIKRIDGIINGTTNFILTSMLSDNLTFEESLKLAQKKGFAELNPESDIKGFDMLRKIRILSLIGYGCDVAEDDIIVKGIENIKKEDLDLLKSKNFFVKLIAESFMENEKAYISIFPTVLTQNDLLASINYSENAVLIDTNYTSKLVFIGQGAGRFPTANAIVNDVLDIKNKNSYKKYKATKNYKNSAYELKNHYYVRGKIDSSLIEMQLKDDVYITKELNYEEVKDIKDSIKISKEAYNEIRINKK